jgi:hypothetical protein
MEPAPLGWGRRLHEQADLEASFEEIKEFEGFTGESLRARVRSLQLRMPEAERCFRRTVELAAGPDVDPELAALNAAYHREHDLLSGRPPQRRSFPMLRIADEKAKALLSLHRSLDALEALHSGRPEDAESIYRWLMGDTSNVGPERLALWNVGLGVAAAQQDDGREARRRLEVAGLHACDPGCRALGRVQIAARLAHVWEYLHDLAAADDWLAFLSAVRCPEATKGAMRRRANLLNRRSLRLGRCVLC